jgi:hypothetical protein
MHSCPIENAIQADRLKAKSINSVEHFHRIQGHSTEAQVNSVLRELSNIVVDGSQNEKELTYRVVWWLRQCQ